MGWGCRPIHMNPGPTCWGSIAYNCSCGCTIWWQTEWRCWLGFSSCWTSGKKVLKTCENKLPGACHCKHEKWRIVSVGAWIRLCVFVIWRLAADNSWRCLPPRIQKRLCQRSLWSLFPGRACIAELVIAAAHQSWASCCKPFFSWPAWGNCYRSCTVCHLRYFQMLNVAVLLEIGLRSFSFPSFLLNSAS